MQAYFRPSKIEGTEEVNWLGYLQSLWVDPCGNLREDSNQDKRLNLNEDLWHIGLLDGGEDVNGKGVLDRPISEDKIVTYYSDATTSDTLIYRYTNHYLYTHPLDCDGAGDPGDYVYETLALEVSAPSGKWARSWPIGVRAHDVSLLLLIPIMTRPWMRTRMDLLIRTVKSSVSN